MVGRPPTNHFFTVQLVHDYLSIKFNSSYYCSCFTKLSFQIPVDVSQSPNTPKAVSPSTLNLTVHGVIKQPDFVLLADPLRKDTEALIVQVSRLSFSCLAGSLIDSQKGCLYQRRLEVKVILTVMKQLKQLKTPGNIPGWSLRFFSELICNCFSCFITARITFISTLYPQCTYKRFIS